MSRDLTDTIDDYCREQHDHSNWAWRSSDTKEFWDKQQADKKGAMYGDVFIYFEASEEKE